MSAWKGQYVERQGKRVCPLRRIFQFWRNADADRDGDADLLRQAADELDAQWKADADRGLRDSFDGAEYQRTCIAPRLRNMADMLEAA